MMNAKMKKLLKKAVKGSNAFKYDWFARKQKWVNKINSNSENGKVAVLVNSVDCDMCRAIYHVNVSATYTAVQAFMDETLEGAEGPTSFEIYPPSELEGQKRQTRDLAMEAFEDGHAHCVHL